MVCAGCVGIFKRVTAAPLARIYVVEMRAVAGVARLADDGAALDHLAGLRRKRAEVARSASPTQKP